MTEPATALELFDTVLDDGSFTSWDVPLDRPSGPYGEELARAAARAGVDESVLTGAGTVHGRPVAVVGCEFAFLAGSIGAAAAGRLVAAVERATAEGLPLLASTASAGTRMQEGTGAFWQMVAITRAVNAHRAAGLPYLVHLRHPTVGGVLASWGSLGHVTVAQPGALVGFLGPRVYSALHGEEFPDGVQTAEHLLGVGVLDAVLPAGELAGLVDRALRVLTDPPSDVRAPAPDEVAPDEVLPDVPAWTSVQASRDPRRPGVRALLRHAATDVVPLHGTGEGERDPAVLLALARIGGQPCVVLGQDRDRQSLTHALGPAALRTARRGMRLAQELRLPLVTVVDTPGAALSVAAEEGGLAGEIARCLSEMLAVDVPTLSVLLGQGSGGAALALMPAQRRVAALHGWLAPLPPEGASAIVHRTPDRAAELAAAQGVRSVELLAAGIVHRVVAEHPDAADEPEAFCRRVGAVIAEELAGLGASG